MVAGGCRALSSAVLLSEQLSPHGLTITITVMARTLTITVTARTLTITVMARTHTVTAPIIMAVRDTITIAIIGTITGTITSGAAVDGAGGRTLVSRQCFLQVGDVGGG